MKPGEFSNGQYADVNGLRMYYEIHGQGEPLLLIHGAASTIETSFGQLLPQLAKNNTVIGVEMQAHGHSNNRDGRPISFEQDADDVIALLGQLGIARAAVFGFSNGATTALQVAIRKPSLVSKIIFASSMYKRSGVNAAFWQGFDHASIDEMPGAYKEVFKTINPNEADLQMMFDQCVQRMLRFTDIADEEVAAIDTPTLILCGDHDVPLPEHAVEMYRVMKNASLAIFPGGHGDYMGELLSRNDNAILPPALPVIEEFLKM